MKLIWWDPIKFGDEEDYNEPNIVNKAAVTVNANLPD